MKLSRILKTFYNVKILKRKYPFALRMDITNKCELSCIYCKDNKNEKELPIDNFISIIPALKDIGIERISISGGNPLLKKGIEKLIFTIKKHNISPILNSNGFNLENIDKKTLKSLDLIQLSIDAIGDSNDLIRGKNSFKTTINAMELLSKYKIPFTIMCTITKYNINQLEDMINLAIMYKSMVAFQPIKNIFGNIKNFKDIIPTKEEFKSNISKIINIKKSIKAKYIRNSLSGLLHIYDWPNYLPLKCSAGKYFFIIKPYGTIMPCDRTDKPYDINLPNIIDPSYIEKIYQLPDPNKYCNGCGFCGALELNYFYNNQFLPLLHILKL